jgi:hypothetical protein
MNHPVEALFARQQILLRNMFGVDDTLREQIIESKRFNELRIARKQINRISRRRSSSEFDKRWCTP